MDNKELDPVLESYCQTTRQEFQDLPGEAQPVSKFPTYTAKTVLCYTSPHYDFSRCQWIQSSSPLQVYDDSKKLIGYAKLEFKLDRLMADITIDYATPERLMAETGSQKVYARIMGEVVLEDESEDDNSPYLDIEATVPVIHQIQVDYLVLTTDTPKDTRLQPFGVLVF